MKPFGCDVSEHEGWSVVSVCGDITEAANFVPFVDRLRERVRIDLGEVTRINSSGVRQWLRFVESLGLERTVLLERCAVAFVQQLNMIANMAGCGRVTSIMLPFFCEACDAERTLLVANASDGPAHADARQSCPECGSAMEFDDVPESYFSFVRR